MDAERVHLKGLTNLQGLVLPKQITDAGLVHLKEMTKLENLTKLYLYNCEEITKAQIDELQKALPKCEIKHDAK